MELKTGNGYSNIKNRGITTMSYKRHNGKEKGNALMAQQGLKRRRQNDCADGKTRA